MSNLETILHDAKQGNMPQNNSILNTLVAPVQAETHNSLLKTDPKYLRDWVENPMYQAIVKNTQSTDNTSTIADLASGLLQYGRPMAWGRELCHIKETMHESAKFRLSTEGQATESGAGDTFSLHSQAARHEFVEAKCNIELDSTETISETQIEDYAQTDTLGEMMQECMWNLQKLETTKILGVLKTIKDGSGNAGRVTKGNSGEANENPSVDLLIDLKKLVAKQNHHPNAYVMDVDSFYTILKDDEMKSSDYFQGHYDWENPVMDTMNFLGCKVFVSTLAPANVIYCLDTRVTVCMAIRRQPTPRLFEIPSESKSGIRCSCRIGLVAGRKEGLAHWS